MSYETTHEWSFQSPAPRLVRVKVRDLESGGSYEVFPEPGNASVKDISKACEKALKACEKALRARGLKSESGRIGKL